MEIPISGDNSTTTTTDNQATGHVLSAGETSQSNGQSGGQTGHVDELFQGVDVNKLPPELKAQHDNMVKSYRDKTQKLSETTKSEIEKAVSGYRDKAGFYDQIAAQEEFVKQWNDYVQKAQSAAQNGQSTSDPVLSQMKQQLQEMNQKIQLSELSQITEAFAGAVTEKGDKINPLFDQLNDIVIGKLGSGDRSESFSLLRGCVELATGNSPQEKLANGYKEAKSVYDSIFEAGRKAGMGRLQMKAANATNPPSGSTGEVLSITEKKPKSAREAIEMARKGIMVSRE